MAKQHPSHARSPFLYKKKFGQHFLHDQSILQKIVKVLNLRQQDPVIEIGPGHGALTQHLLAQTARLIALEIDADSIPILQEKCAPLGRLDIIQADVLKIDFSQYFPAEQLRLVGNLPYNISTPILFHCLNQAAHIEDMHFMLQKEVARRLVALPGTADYGRLSVMLQYYAEIHLLFNISAGAFTPPPKVESSLVHIKPYTSKPYQAQDENHFAQVVKQCFAHRRKTLRNNLKGILDDTHIISVGIEPQTRGETLDVAQFVRLSDCLTANKMKPANADFTLNHPVS